MYIYTHPNLIGYRTFNQFESEQLLWNISKTNRKSIY